MIIDEINHDITSVSTRISGLTRWNSILVFSKILSRRLFQSIPDKLVKSDSRETGEEESHKKLQEILHSIFYSSVVHRFAGSIVWI